jgi:hypothetical protein
MTVLIGMSCSNKKQKREIEKQIEQNGYPQIKFDTTYYDFGTLIQGEQVAHSFKFKNTGKSDLIIFDAYSTCGCTVPDYSKEPISPGEEGKIEVVFNSEGKTGLQYKTVTLKLNTKIEQKSLTIKANVMVKNV